MFTIIDIYMVAQSDNLGNLWRRFVIKINICLIILNLIRRVRH